MNERKIIDETLKDVTPLLQTHSKNLATLQKKREELWSEKRRRIRLLEDEFDQQISTIWEQMASVRQSIQELKDRRDEVTVSDKDIEVLDRFFDELRRSIQIDSSKVSIARNDLEYLKTRLMLSVMEHFGMTTKYGDFYDIPGPHYIAVHIENITATPSQELEGQPCIYYALYDEFAMRVKSMIDGINNRVVAEVEKLRDKLLGPLLRGDEKSFVEMRPLERSLESIQEICTEEGIVVKVKDSVVVAYRSGQDGS